MAPTVLNSFPIHARLRPRDMKHGSLFNIAKTPRIHAKEIIASDRARALKFLRKEVQGHGPHVVHEARRRRHHHHHGSTAEPTDPTSPDPSSTNSVSVTDASVTYTIPVQVGANNQTFTLLIDTGSSNTWVGAQTKYQPSSTAVDTRDSVKVSYGSGSFSGTEYTDTVTLGEGLTIEKQSIGVASTAQGFSDVDGILGIGPVDLTNGTVANTTNVPTVTDNLLSQGTISVESIGCYYAPTGDDTMGAGELTFGGTDPSKIVGDMTYVPITKTSPASAYWGVDQSISYGNQEIMATSAGIVDTGTTLLLLPSTTFNAYQQAIGATMDNTTGLLTVTQEQFDNMESLFFTLNGTQFEMTANAQIWPRSMNSQLGGDNNKIYLVASSIGDVGDGDGLVFINGFVFLQRFYTEYDTTNSRVGFAQTAHTNDTSN